MVKVCVFACWCVFSDMCVLCGLLCDVVWLACLRCCVLVTLMCVRFVCACLCNDVWFVACVSFWCVL